MLLKRLLLSLALGLSFSGCKKQVVITNKTTETKKEYYCEWDPNTNIHVHGLTKDVIKYYVHYSNGVVLETSKDYWEDVQMGEVIEP